MDERACRAFLVAARSGDREAIRAALAPILPGVVASVRAVLGRLSASRHGIEAADIEQEVVLRMLSWVPTDVPKHARAKVLAWSEVVASNLVHNRWRFEKRFVSPTRTEEEDGGPVREFPDGRRRPVEQLLDVGRAAAQIERCAAHLGAPYAEVYRLALESDDLSADALALHFDKLTREDLEALAAGGADQALRDKVARARYLMDQWKMRMRLRLAECLERALGPGALPDGLRFGGSTRGKGRGRAS